MRIMKFGLLILLPGFFFINVTTSQTLLAPTIVPDGQVYAMAQDGNTLYLGGQFRGGGYRSGGFSKISLDDDRPDMTFPFFNPSLINGAIPDSGGGWYIFGNHYLIHLLPGGKVDSTFTPNPTGEIKCLLLTDNKLFVGGRFTGIGGASISNLAAISPVTGLSMNWNPNLGGQVFSISSYDSTLICGGQFGVVNGELRQNLAFISMENAQLDSVTFNVNNYVNKVVVDDSTLYLSGAFNQVSGLSRQFLASINLNSQTLNSFAPNPNNIVSDLFIDTAHLYIAGDFSAIQGKQRNFVAKLSKANGILNDTWNPNPNSSVYSILRHNQFIYLAGQFDNVNNQLHNNLARVDTVLGILDKWDPRPQSTAIFIASDSKNVYVASRGNFFKYQDRNNLLSIDLTGDTITTWNPGTNGNVLSILLQDSILFIGGSFNTIAGVSRNRIASISKFTGVATSWNPDASNGNYYSDVLTMHLDDTTLYVGGHFSEIGGQPRSRIAALSIFTGLAASFDANLGQAIVYQIKTTADRIYVGGSFGFAGGLPRGNIAAYNKKDGSLLTWNPSVEGDVKAIRIVGNLIYIGGTFPRVGNIERKCLAAVTKSGALSPWNPSVEGRVEGMEIRNERVFIAGNFSEVNGQICSNFDILNIHTGLSYGHPPKFDTYVNNLLASHNILLCAGYFRKVNETPYFSIAALNLEPEIFQTQVSHYSPQTAGNSGAVTLTIEGGQFEAGTSVKLTRQGYPDIVIADSLLENIEGTMLLTTLNLRQKDTGYYDIVVAIPNDTIITLVNGLHIVKGIEPDPWASIMGPSRMRTNTWKPFTVTYGNRGNVNATGVPVWIFVQGDTSIEAKMNFELYMDSNYTFQNKIRDSILPYIIVDKLFNDPRGGVMFALFLPVIPANSSGTLTFSIKSSTPTDLKLYAYANPPYFRSPIDPVFADCLYNIITNAIKSAFADILGIEDCVNASHEIMASVAIAAGGYLGGSPKFDKQNIAWQLAESIFKCAASQYPASKIYRVVYYIIKTMAFLNDYDPCLRSLLNDTRTENETTTTPDLVNNVPNGVLPVQTLQSYDPNEKLGPIGAGSESYINTNTPLIYNISFENSPTLATAPANTVILIDTLDMNVYDISSFELGDIYFGDKLINVPKGRQSFKTKIDLRPNTNLIVDVAGNLDFQKGIAMWTFTSLNPVDLEINPDPDLGFLPPNISSPSGEGGVFFTISPKKSSPDGTLLLNKGYIYFDNNPPVITPTWKNVFDNGLPESNVSQMDAGSMGVVRDVYWSGTDSTSGINSYSIYYSVNGGEYKLWLKNTRANSAKFRGEIDSSYSFYSVVADSAGNVELPPSVADAQTSFSSNFRWIGTTSTDWLNKANWSGGVVPGKNDDVVIMAGTSFSPIIANGVIAQCNSLAILSGAMLIVHGKMMITH